MAYQLGGGIKSVRRLYADSAKCEPWPGKGFLRFSGICVFSSAHINIPEMAYQVRIFVNRCPAVWARLVAKTFAVLRPL